MCTVNSIGANCVCYVYIVTTHKLEITPNVNSYCSVYSHNNGHYHDWSDKHNNLDFYIYS